MGRLSLKQKKESPFQTDYLKPAVMRGSRGRTVTSSFRGVGETNSIGGLLVVSEGGRRSQVASVQQPRVLGRLEGQSSSQCLPRPGAVPAGGLWQLYVHIQNWCQPSNQAALLSSRPWTVMHAVSIFIVSFILSTDFITAIMSFR